MKRRSWMLCVLITLPTQGCGTIGWMVTSDQGGNHPAIYGGVHYDVTEMIPGFFRGGDYLSGSLMIIDVPVSFVADTLLLPVIGLGYLYDRGEPQDASEKKPAE